MLNEDVLKIIGKELKLTRIEHNMNLQEVSDKTGIAITTIINYENSKTQMYMDKILDILKAYDDVTPSIFFKRITTKM